jgi:LDH2 family malate/lactate/ureidoglycolate dehydrogenase
VTNATIAPVELEVWAVAILEAAGASPEAASATARCLVRANQRGIDSHGIVFLNFYLPRLRVGTTKGNAHPEIVINLPAIALVDGHHGLGAHVASFGMSLCCEKAKAGGAAVVAVRNSGHFGAASHYAELAAERGYIGIAVSNSDPGMAPLGAHAAVLGTNPLAIAAPAAAGVATPSLDIATSVVAQGKIILASRAGMKIPLGWAIGPDGMPTDDADVALAGAVLPMAGHKGFALAFMIDVLAGCLPGALLSPEIAGSPSAATPEGTGHCFFAIEVEALRARGDYEASLKRLAAFVHSAPRAGWAEPFMFPGEQEARTTLDRSVNLPLTGPTLNLLRILGSDFGVPFPI